MKDSWINKQKIYIDRNQIISLKEKKKYAWYKYLPKLVSKVILCFVILKLSEWGKVKNNSWNPKEIKNGIITFARVYEHTGFHVYTFFKFY